MPTATPPSIRSWTGRLSACGLVWSWGSTVVVSMSPACCAVPGTGMGKNPHPTLITWPPDQGSPGWRRTRLRRDDGYVEERSGPASPGLADGQGDPWRPWPGHDGGAPEDGWPRRRRPWRRGRHRQWVGRPRGSGPVRRSQEDRLVAGLAAGIAARTGIDVTLVRLAFVVAALLGGFGVAAYVAGWLLLPAAGADSSIAHRALHDPRGPALAPRLRALLFLMLIIAPALRAPRPRSAAVGL